MGRAQRDASADGSAEWENYHALRAAEPRRMALVSAVQYHGEASGTFLQPARPKELLHSIAMEGQIGRFHLLPPCRQQHQLVVAGSTEDGCTHADHQSCVVSRRRRIGADIVINPWRDSAINRCLDIAINCWLEKHVPCVKAEVAEDNERTEHDDDEMHF